MIVIINGPCGVGKTAVSWELNSRFKRSVMLDGDYLGAVHPFEIYNEGRIDYLYRIIALLVDFHQREGAYTHFVINYVFESPESLADLLGRLRPLDDSIFTFRLTADAEIMAERITRRESSSDDRAWHLNRFVELQAIQEKAAGRGDLGRLIDTSTITVDEVVDLILNLLPSQ